MIVSFVLAFAVITIVAILIAGVPGNSFHASALSWSYFLIMLCLGLLLGDAAMMRYWGPTGGAAATLTPPQQ